MLRKDQSINNRIINQMIGDHSRSAQSGERIRNIVRDYEHRDVIDFLSGIANNIQI